MWSSRRDSLSSVTRMAVIKLCRADSSRKSQPSSSFTGWVASLQNVMRSAPSVITKSSALLILMDVEIFRASFAGSSECGPGKTWARFA